MKIDQKRAAIEPNNPDISIIRQCELFDLPRSSFYSHPRGESAENLDLMKRIDMLHLAYPFYGCRKIGVELNIDKDHALRLIRKMGIETLYPRRNLSRRNAEHKIYPYLLRNVSIDHVNHVWSTDITYIPMRNGYVYLTAVIDWYSRYVLSWELSNTLETSFCVSALTNAFERYGRPEIFNTDQGTQFSSDEFTSTVLSHGVAMSMDGRGRALDNVFIERLWRSVKYEEVYINSYETVWELSSSLNRYFDFYNNKRIHQSLNYQTPSSVYNQSATVEIEKKKKIKKISQKN